MAAWSGAALSFVVLAMSGQPLAAQRAKRAPCVDWWKVGAFNDGDLDFILDTTFHVVDAETTWVANIQQQSESMVSELSKYFERGAKVASPWPLGDDVLVPVKKALAAVGYDSSDVRDPSMLDLTEMFNTLRDVDKDGDMKGLRKDGDMIGLYGVRLSEMQDRYKSYSRKISFLCESRDVRFVLQLVQPIYWEVSSMVTNYYSNMAEGRGRSAFFLVEPLFAHGSLLFTLATLRAAATVGIAVSLSNERLLEDACRELESFMDTWGEYYDLVNKYAYEAQYSRLDSIDEHFCDEYRETAENRVLRWVLRLVLAVQDMRESMDTLKGKICHADMVV